MKPKKSLGQNFLTSIPARIAIVSAGQIKKGEKVLEIGPGKGMLTYGLLDAEAHVIAVEKDRELIPYLQELFAKEKNFTLIEGDALEFDPTNCKPLSAGYKLIANIPYYITGAILARYLTHVHQPSRMVVLVQKEVATRIVARDGKHSLLSLSVHVYGTPSIIKTISKGSFFPIPRVDSAILCIQDISRKHFKNTVHEEWFFKTIHSGFAHKRKLLIRNLETVAKKELLETVFDEYKIAKSARAENVTLPQWLQLSYRLSTL